MNFPYRNDWYGYCERMLRMGEFWSHKVSVSVVNKMFFILYFTCLLTRLSYEYDGKIIKEMLRYSSMFYVSGVTLVSTETSRKIIAQQRRARVITTKKQHCRCRMHFKDGRLDFCHVPVRTAPVNRFWKRNKYLKLCIRDFLQYKRDLWVEVISPSIPRIL